MTQYSDLDLEDPETTDLGGAQDSGDLIAPEASCQVLCINQYSSVD